MTLIPQTQINREREADRRAALDADASEIAREALAILQGAARQIAALTGPLDRVQIEVNARDLFEVLAQGTADAVTWWTCDDAEIEADWTREEANVWPAQKEAV